MSQSSIIYNGRSPCPIQNSYHSTELAAAEVIDSVIQNIHNNKIPLNVYLDLSKAFNTLDHQILLHIYWIPMES